MIEDIIASKICEIPQLDGLESLSSSFTDNYHDTSINSQDQNNESQSGFGVPVVNNIIPTIITGRENRSSHSATARRRCLKTIKRSNKRLNTAELPTVLNINPRSCYGKSEELSLIISQYSADLITISESWSRDDKPLMELIQIEDYKVKFQTSY